MELEDKRRFLIGAAFYTSVILISYFLLKALAGALFPFAAALILTVFLQGVIRKISTGLKIKKKIISVILIVLIYAAALILSALAVYVLYRQLRSLSDFLPYYFGKLSDAVEKISAFSDRISAKSASDGIFESLKGATSESIATKVSMYVADIAASFLAGVPVFFLSLIVMIIANTYLAKDYDDIVRFFTSCMPKDSVKKLIKSKNVIKDDLGGMAKGYAILAVITFAELLTGFLLLKIDYAFLIAALTALVDILPVLGTGTVLVPWAVVKFVTGGTATGIWLIVLYIVITVVRNIVEPKVIGKAAGVHPLIMLAAVFFGLKLFGAAGIIILPAYLIVLKGFAIGYFGSETEAVQDIV